MIRQLIFDIDGTICADHNTISPALLDAFQKLQDKGLKIALASGRPACDVHSFQEKNKFYVPSILLNGAAISYYDGHIDHCVYMLEEDVEAIFETLGKFDAPFVCYLKDEMYEIVGATKNYRDTIIGIMGKEDEDSSYFDKFVPISQDTININEILKIEACFEKPEEMQEARNLLKPLQRIQAVSSMGFNLEITSVLSSKGIAVASYIESLNLQKDEVMVFGDGENDISMFELFSHSVFVDNKNKEKFYETEYTTDSCKNDGVAKFLKEYFNLV